MPRRRFHRPELERFLVAIDRELATPGSVVVIGGAAAILQYGATSGTVDIDTYSVGPVGLETAIRTAWEKSGIKISVEYAGVADAPFHYEDRLERLRSPWLSRLEVLVPERHDLALMKIARGEERDLVVLEQLHALKPFDREVLVTRFLDEMTHAVQDLRSLRLKFLVAVGRFYGREAAEEVRDRLMRVPAERDLAATSVVVNGRPLHRSGIHPETIALARFAGEIRQDGAGAIVFPLRDRLGVVGLAIEMDKGPCLRGEPGLGLWTSLSQDGDRRVAIVSDPVDALALHQAKPTTDTQYVATAGAIGPERARLLRERLVRSRDRLEVVLGFANDAGGSKLVSAVRQLAPTVPMTIVSPPNLASWREFVRHQERTWIRAQGLEMSRPGRGR